MSPNMRKWRSCNHASITSSRASDVRGEKRTGIHDAVAQAAPNEQSEPKPDGAGRDAEHSADWNRAPVDETNDRVHATHEQIRG